MPGDVAVRKTAQGAFSIAIQQPLTLAIYRIWRRKLGLQW
jgi:hypothetical protein